MNLPGSREAYFLFIYVNKARINIPNKSIREIAWNVDMSITPFLKWGEPGRPYKPFICTIYIIHEKNGNSHSILFTFFPSSDFNKPFITIHASYVYFLPIRHNSYFTTRTFPSMTLRLCFRWFCRTWIV